MESGLINIENVYKELLILKRDMENLKSIVSENFELSDDVLEEIKESQERSEGDFIPNEEMEKEFG